MVALQPTIHAVVDAEGHRSGLHSAAADQERDTAAMPVCRNDVPVEYAGEEQAICAVGLAKPKPGIFMAAIQHLLVLCTTTEARVAPCRQRSHKRSLLTRDR